MRLDEDQVGSLELAISEAEDPEAGVRRWLEVKEQGTGAALDRSRKERAGGVVTSEERARKISGLTWSRRPCGSPRKPRIGCGASPARRGGHKSTCARRPGARLRREYADLDWITQKGKSTQAQRFFESLGCVPQARFNTMYGRERCSA